MGGKTDLDWAMNFVVHRIEKEATESGHPLTEEERSLIKNLPSSTYSPAWAPNLGPPKLVPRDWSLERLSALAKAAYATDCQTKAAAPDWQFAFAVFTLNNHPMWGILLHAGLKYRRPLADQFSVLIAGLLVVFGLAFAITSLLFAQSRLWALCLSLGAGLGLVATAVWLYFAAKKAQDRRLEKEIEEWRLASHSLSIGAR
jgi:hypothetical protein